MSDFTKSTEAESEAESELTAVNRLTAEDIAKKQTGAAVARERTAFLKNQKPVIKTVGEPEDFIPFAWRHPLQVSGHRRVSKVLKNMAAAESERAGLVPAGNPTDK